MVVFLLFALVVLENTGFVGFTSVFERYLALFVVDKLNLVFFEAMLAALALEWLALGIAFIFSIESLESHLPTR